MADRSASSLPYSAGLHSSIGSYDCRCSYHRGEWDFESISTEQRGRAAEPYAHGRTGVLRWLS